MSINLTAEHGSICALENEFYGYFGWPSVARLEDGTLLAIASGLRYAHVCPFGRTVLCVSRDDGRTWSTPHVVNDSPLDDRDAGVVALGGKKILISWFTTDTRIYSGEDQLAGMEPQVRKRWEEGLITNTDEATARWQGAWIRVSPDAGETWGVPTRLPVTAPHGPIRLQSGVLLYLGKEFGADMDEFVNGTGRVSAMRSTDDGATWQMLGSVPIYPGTHLGSYHEPHMVELPSGKLIGVIRVQDHGDCPKLEGLGLVPFSMMQTESTDGGHTWSHARPLGFHGNPPHLLRHSSGTLVLSYGYRQQPYGERIALSHDEGATWQHDYVLRDDGPDGDLGYPASVELGDGSIITVYYQKPHSTGDKCALLWSRWRLPV